MRVDHAEGEYVRDAHIHTNTVEGYYSIFKRGMKGVYRHCREKHLHRYLAEFDFRYSNRSSLGIEDCERGACRKGRGWQASHVSGTSLDRISNITRARFCDGAKSILGGAGYS
jgi:hypothetical protein